MKCSNCNADITGMDSHTRIGWDVIDQKNRSTVAGTDAIENIISWIDGYWDDDHGADVPDVFALKHAREQLAALIERIARAETKIEKYASTWVKCRSCDGDEDELCAIIAEKDKRIATLEQHIFRLQHTPTCVCDAPERIQQAEKRGYELARKIVMEQWETDLRSYDQAVEERDGGS